MKKSIFQLFAFLILISLTVWHFSCGNDPVVTTSDTEKIIDKDAIWSPNGDYISYVSSFEPFGIYKINIDGSDKRLIIPSFARNLDFSPDGQWLVYVLGSNIFKSKINGDTTIQLTFSGSNFSPSWSSDGLWIAFDSNNESPNGMGFVWKMRSDGSQKKRIIYTPTQGEVREPDWFPDNSRLVVTRFVGHGGSEIGIMDTSGNSILLLTNDREDDVTPKVSPDGQYVTFCKYINGGQLITVRADGSEHQVVNDRNSRFPTWSPDNLKIAYTNTTDGRIWYMLKTGSFKTKLSY